MYCINEISVTGIGMGTFHAGRVQRLAVELKISRVPRIVAVINGRTSDFRGHVTLHNLRQFVRNLFPKTLIQPVRILFGISYSKEPMYKQQRKWLSYWFIKLEIKVIGMHIKWFLHINFQENLHYNRIGLHKRFKRVVLQ